MLITPLHQPVHKNHTRWPWPAAPCHMPLPCKESPLGLTWRCKPESRMPPSPERTAHAAAVALPQTLTSWRDAFDPGAQRDSESWRKKHTVSLRQKLTLASIRKPVKLLRICSVPSPEFSTDSASNRRCSPSTLNQCCICRGRNCKYSYSWSLTSWGSWGSLTVFLLWIKSQCLIYY